MLGCSVRRCSECFLILVNCAFLLCIPAFLSMPCEHRPPSTNQFIRGVLLDDDITESDRAFSSKIGSGHHSVVRRSFEQPLRIHLSYDSSITSLSATDLAIVQNEVLEPAVTFWSRTLSVRASSSAIKLYQSCKEGRLKYYGSDPQPYCQLGCESMTTCGDVIVPADHLAACRSASDQSLSDSTVQPAGQGVSDTDFILYVASIATSRCNGPAVAYAAYCQLEVQLDRPVAGYINICPKEFLLDLSKQVEMLTSVVKHEILHAIGFSLGLFAFYRDPTGQPLTPRGIGNLPPEGSDGLYKYSDKVAKVVRRRNWLQKGGLRSWNVTMLVTPRVVREVQQHFNCTSLEGAELENQGESGTQLTHWEKRVFENELMTGIYTTLPVVSRITLALLEDTGWYSANYDNAEPLEWGANLGCDFVQNSCYYWMLTRRNSSIHPFCNRAPDITTSIGGQTALTTVTECGVNRHSKTMCNLQSYDLPLPAPYQYFENASLGGYVELADYCPYVQVFNYKQNDVAVRDSRCMLSSNQPGPTTNYGAETYSADSRCFEQQKPFVVSSCSGRGMASVALTYGSGCYTYECNANTGLTIKILGNKYRCYYAGQNISVVGVVSLGTNTLLHKGVISCPSCSSICPLERQTPCPPDEQPQSSFDHAASDVSTCAAVSSSAARLWMGPPLYAAIAASFIATLAIVATTHVCDCVGAG